MCFFGAEQHSSHFEQGKAAFEKGAGDDEVVMEDDAHSSIDEEKVESRDVKTEQV